MSLLSTRALFTPRTLHSSSAQPSHIASLPSKPPAVFTPNSLAKPAELSPKLSIGFRNFAPSKYPLTKEFIDYFGDHPFGHIVKPLKPGGLVLLQDSEYEKFLNEKRRLSEGKNAKEFFVLAPWYGMKAMAGGERLLEQIIKASHGIFSRRSDGAIENRITGETFAKHEHPLQVAGRLIQEDILLLQKQGTEYVVAGGSVHFPSQWSPRQKLHQGMDAVHTPVPFYQKDLAAKVNRFLDYLNYQPQIRFTALVHNSDELSRLPQKSNQAKVVKQQPTIEDLQKKFFIRLERETFQRLNQNQIVMFIRSQIVPLKTVETDPVLAQVLLKVFEKMPTVYQNYRGMEHYHSALINYLKCHAKAR